MSKRVFIGVGHGGKDPGALKYIKEADANLQMALGLKAELERHGVTAVSYTHLYDLPPFSTQAYHYRVFTVNQAGQLNDKQEGATASVTLTAKEPGAVTNLAATDEKGTTTGRFDLHVVMVEGRDCLLYTSRCV